MSIASVVRRAMSHRLRSGRRTRPKTRCGRRATQRTRGPALLENNLDEAAELCYPIHGGGNPFARRVHCLLDFRRLASQLYRLGARALSSIIRGASTITERRHSSPFRILRSIPPMHSLLAGIPPRIHGVLPWRPRSLRGVSV